MAFLLERASVTGLPADRSGGWVAAFTHLYLPRMHRLGYVAPNLGDVVGENSPGGFVMDSRPGLYDPVLVLDYKSLYPSIIRTFLIDPVGLIEGLRGSTDDQSVPGFLGARFSRTMHCLPEIVRQVWEGREHAKRQKNAPLSQALKIIMNASIEKFAENSLTSGHCLPGPLSVIVAAMTEQRKNQRQIQKEATRQRIVSTALELFVSRGYVATTVDDIAAAANTTRVTFYSHFESRRELMRALIHELNGILERRDEPGRNSTASLLVAAVREGSREKLGGWLHEQAVRWPLIKPYLLAVTEAAAVDAEMRSLMRNWIEEVVADICEGLDAANRYEPGTRHFRGELAYVALDQTALSWMRGDLDLTTEPALEVLTELWWKMLGAP